MTDLFLAAGDPDASPDRSTAGSVPLSPGAVLLPGFAAAEDTVLLGAVAIAVASAPFRHLSSRRGHRIAAAMTRCGRLGWHSDRHGYRYLDRDPDTGVPWPEMPSPFRDLRRRAAAAAGWPGFMPDTCLINRHRPDIGMALHRDADERSPLFPIVSVSLGLPARFRFGGDRRADRYDACPSGTATWRCGAVRRGRRSTGSPRRRRAGIRWWGRRASS